MGHDHQSVQREWRDVVNARAHLDGLQKKWNEAKRARDKDTQKQLDRDIRAAKRDLAREEREYLDAVHEAVGEEALSRIVGDKIKGLPRNAVGKVTGSVRNAAGRFNPKKYLNKQPSMSDIKREASTYDSIADTEIKRYRQSGRNMHGIQYAGRCGTCNLNGARHSPSCPVCPHESFNSVDRA